MSNISWTSSSLSSYFSTSLNTSSAFSSMYSSLNDASMIKSGAYKKLMKSYVSQVESSSSTSSTSSTTSSKKTTRSSTYLDDLLASKEDSTSTSSSSSSTASASTTTSASAYDSTGKSTSSKIKNTVLDELLEHKTYVSNSSSTYLDDLLKANEEAAGANTVTATTDGSVVNKTEAAGDANSSSSTGTVSEMGAGAVIDAAV